MDGKYEQLEQEKCCYTCNHNRNNFSKDYPCNCEFENRKSNVFQDEMACDDYESCDK